MQRKSLSSLSDSRQKSAFAARLSRLRKPANMSLESWQVALRRQFATEQKYRVRNLGKNDKYPFSDYKVTNPGTKRTYRVSIRGDELGANYCSCPDFSVNTLGTCKHIEYLLGKLRRKSGARKAFAAGYQPPFSEIYLRYGVQRQVIFRPATGCPDAIIHLAATCFDDYGVLRMDALPAFSSFLRRLSDIRDGHEVRCYDDALLFVSRLQDREERVKRINRFFPDGGGAGQWNKVLKTRLYPYQQHGTLFAAKAGRCLIADDMGLGKTIQAIAAAEILARHAGVKRTLIVCPTSLKHQWLLEIERFTDRRALVVEGLAAKRQTLYGSETFFTIVNYDVIHRDAESIRAAKYDLIVLDEAQRIKNWKTRAAKSVKQLDSDYAFVLTGTPLENRLEELHSIVEFVDRHRLGPMFRFLDNHQLVDESGRVIGYRNLDQIARTMEGMLVRRTKDTVLKDLPERLEKHFFVTMTEEQMLHHEENREIVARIVAKWKRYGYLSDIDQRRLTCALQNMRMSCDSTYLLDSDTDYGHKICELTVLLDEILEDREVKVVVFSQWLRMHELMAREFARRRWDHVLFHGGVPGHQRKSLVSRFRDDPNCRLFMATDAGGVGLNLQNASVVVNVDLPWNPAVLEQRVGRVHRLGQHRPVRVVHFVAKGTIEEGMLSLLDFKKSMFAGVLDGGEKEVFLGGTRLKKFMDSVETATGRIPPDETACSGKCTSAAPVGAMTDEKPAHSPSKPVSPFAGVKRKLEGGAIPPISPQAMGDILTAGANLLSQLGETLRQSANNRTAGEDSKSLPGVIECDESTGRTYLKLPLPDKDVLSPLIGLLQRIFEV